MICTKKFIDSKYNVAQESHHMEQLISKMLILPSCERETTIM
ncbi:hypothetical protein OIU76_019183 [Salix suchowensis]|uniref:Uncharacterized protein n=1 Tax=Salix koriyanagi TaxID=2511006 RepID=A0A9Q0X0D3_9ROSI|nr:hypothetical protein OIU76_019183 [Salix suchowensis]KAJ6314131.1 hypothetical protein OIU78_017733 [Salix suchowensis]KAJ6776409.1 hypothetical protein OIU74_000565 [Salix koriyanagi]